MMVVILIVVLSLFLPLTQQLDLFVDGTNGNDNNPGTQSQPFQTITKARDYIRTLSINQKDGGVVVNIRKGLYSTLSSPGGPLQFTHLDSGTSTSPILYSGYKNEKVLIHSGVLVPPAAFKPLQQGSPIMIASLKPFNIPSYGDFAAGSLGNCNHNIVELFYNSKPQVLARYPNIENGLFKFDQVKAVVNSSEIIYSDMHSSLWAKDTNFWLHGYWKYDWADSYVQVEKVNPSTSSFSINPKTPPVYSFEARARYYAVNLLSELDVPTEYYIDRTNNILYFYPPQQIGPSDEIFLSVGTNVISLIGVGFIGFNNLQVMYATGTGITANNVSNINITNSAVSNHGQASISLFSSTGSKILYNTIFGNGCGGIKIYGGNIKTLTPGNNEVSYNNISFYGRLSRTYNPGISWGGVGNRFTNNIIHDAPHSGILGGGNNCIFQGNYLKDLCYEASDSGAFYTGRSWIERGNLLESNTFENIYNRVPVYLGALQVQGAYLDDQMSGWVVQKNTFLNCLVGILVGGGRRNIVDNNYFSNCTSAVHFDNRGMNWQNASCSEGGVLQQQLFSVNYQEPPYSRAYPEIVNLLQDHPCVPVHNDISRNTYCNVKKFIDRSPAEIASWFSTAVDNVEKCT